MIKEKFKENPLMYYGLSIAASWAGVGSLLNTGTITKTLGICPALIWTAANVFACVLFGLVINKLPALREVINFKPVKYLLAFMGIFHIWLNANGIREIFSDTVIGSAGGEIIAYAVAGAFIFLLLWRGMIRNVLTDSFGWLTVYAIVAFIAVVAFIQSGGEFHAIPAGLDANSITEGAYKAFLLLPGPFTFVYFYALLDYNDNNADATKKVDMTKAFAFGGLFFGAYMVFAFALAFVDFPPELNLLKAVLISLIAISTLSTFIYSIYLVFGRKIGLLIDVIAVALWEQFMELGVMGVWQLVASIRSYLVGAMILAAIVISVRRKNEKSTRTQTINEG